MTEKQRKEFEELARPLVRFLNDNGNPHMTIIITTTSGELVSGECAFYTEEYVLG